METIHFKKLALKRLNKFLDRGSDIAEIAQNYAILVSEFDRIARACARDSCNKTSEARSQHWYGLGVTAFDSWPLRSRLATPLDSDAFRGDGRRYIVESDSC